MKAAFGVEARVEPFHGAWVDLPEEDLTRLGGRDAGNARLGSTALLGSRVFDASAGHSAGCFYPLPPERAAPTCLHWSAGIWGTWGVKSCWKGKGAQGERMGVEQIVMKFAQYSQSICSFDQGFLLKLDAAHAGSKGICYALSSCFILGCLSGKIPEDSFKIISDYNKLDTLVAIQKAYSDFNEDRAGISEEERDKINVEHTFHELMGRTGWFSCPGFTVEPVMKLSNHVGAPASIVGKLVSGAGTPPSAFILLRMRFTVREKILFIKYPVGAGHAIALAQTPSGLYLFDPNLGMFKALGQAELVTMLEFVFQIYEVEHYASIYIT